MILLLDGYDILFLKKFNVIAEGMCLEKTTDKGDTIWEKPTALFKKKFTLIHKSCFEFVKVNYKHFQRMFSGF